MHTSPHPRRRQHPILLGLVEAAKIDLIVVPTAFVAAAIFWLIGLGSQLPYSIIPEWAFALWAAVSGLTVSTLGFDYSLAPSLITFGVWFLAVAAARRLVDGIGDGDVSDIASGQWWKDLGQAVGTFVLAYAGPLLALALLVGEATMTPLGFLRLLLFLVSAVATGFVWVRGIGDIPGLRVIDDKVWSCGSRLAARLVWGSLLLSVVLVAVGVVLRWSEIVETLAGYSSPTAAGIGLLIVQLMFAPGILFSALSWSAGTGVQLGDAGLSSVFHPAAGPVPDVPVLQLLTADYPEWTTAAPVLLFAVGLLSVILGRARAREVLEASWTGVGIALGILFVGVEILALFSRGAMGPLGLADFGPSALTSAIVSVAWIGLGTVAGLGLTKLSQMQDEAREDGAEESTDS